MTTKRRKRSINETEESILSSIQQPLGADNPTQSDSEHLSSSQNSQHSGDASQQGLFKLLWLESVMKEFNTNKVHLDLSKIVDF